MSNQQKRSEEGFNRDISGPKPINTGKEYELQIIKIGRKGYSTDRVQGFVIFVLFVIFVKSGQVGRNVKINKIGNTSATADIV